MTAKVCFESTPAPYEKVQASECACFQKQVNCVDVSFDVVRFYLTRFILCEAKFTHLPLSAKPVPVLLEDWQKICVLPVLHTCTERLEAVWVPISADLQRRNPGAAPNAGVSARDQPE